MAATATDVHENNLVEFDNLAAGTYTIIITDASGCEYSGVNDGGKLDINVEITQTPAIVVSLTDFAMTEGATTGTANLTITGGLVAGTNYSYRIKYINNTNVFTRL